MHAFHRIHPKAQTELEHELEFYERRRTGYGLRFWDAYERALKSALSYPFRGRSIALECRAMPIRGFPFNVVYSPEEWGIIVIAVAHTARRPGYWADRIGEKF